MSLANPRLKEFLILMGIKFIKHQICMEKWTWKQCMKTVIATSVTAGIPALIMTAHPITALPVD